MILAELSFEHQPNPKSRVAVLLPYPLAVLGLYLCSFPSEYADRVRWTQRLLVLGMRIFPNGCDIGRYWVAVGAQILCFSIFYSPSMRRALSNRFLLWLGSISYPLYLLHGTLMRSVLAWFLYAPGALRMKSQPDPAVIQDSSPELDPPIPTPSFLTLAFVLPIFGVFLLYVVNQWAIKVEPYFGAATKSFENFAQSWRGELPGSPRVYQKSRILPLDTKD
jgi:hypothetical protein